MTLFVVTFDGADDVGKSHIIKLAKAMFDTFDVDCEIVHPLRHNPQDRELIYDQLLKADVLDQQAYAKATAKAHINTLNYLHEQVALTPTRQSTPKVILMDRSWQSFLTYQCQAPQEPGWEHSGEAVEISPEDIGEIKNLYEKLIDAAFVERIIVHSNKVCVKGDAFEKMTGNQQIIKRLFKQVIGISTIWNNVDVYGCHTLSNEDIKMELGEILNFVLVRILQHKQKQIDLLFTSGNDVSIDQATIKTKEWKAYSQLVSHYLFCNH